MMRRMPGYPRGFFALLLLVLTILIATGLLLIPHMMLMRLDWETPVRVAGDVRLAGAAVHCAVSFLTMMLVGALAIVHMRSGWARKKNLVSGFASVILFTVLLFSAVGIYYFGNETLSQWSSLIHTVAGLVLVVSVVWHGLVGRRLYLQRRRQVDAKKSVVEGEVNGLRPVSALDS